LWWEETEQLELVEVHELVAGHTDSTASKDMELNLLLGFRNLETLLGAVAEHDHDRHTEVEVRTAAEDEEVAGQPEVVGEYATELLVPYQLVDLLM
jgi:hypothetical protein